MTSKEEKLARENAKMIRDLMANNAALKDQLTAAQKSAADQLATMRRIVMKDEKSKK